MSAIDLYYALSRVMRDIVGDNFVDDAGVADNAREVLTKHAKLFEDKYSDRCIDHALKQRKHAHDMRRRAEEYDRLYPIPTGGKHIGHYDAKAMLRDAIRWIHAAKMARIREASAIEREEYVYECAAE